MSNDVWMKLGVAISVIWLILCIVRIGFYSSFYAGTASGDLFITVLNVLLVIGIVMVVVVFGKQVFRYSAAKTMKGNHCQQCYARLGPDETFCLKCGWEKPKE